VVSKQLSQSGPRACSSLRSRLPLRRRRCCSTCPSTGFSRRCGTRPVSRGVFVETRAGEAACPSCEVFTARVHQRTRQRVRDVPFDGLVTVWWIKKRWRCGETRCHRATFTESTEQVPPRARLTTRLKDRIVAALSGQVRAVDRVFGEYGVAWPTAMRQLTRARARACRAGGGPAEAGSGARDR